MQCRNGPRIWLICPIKSEKSNCKSEAEDGAVKHGQHHGPCPMKTGTSIKKNIKAKKRKNEQNYIFEYLYSSNFK
jgi:hypothetical protein